MDQRRIKLSLPRAIPGRTANTIRLVSLAQVLKIVTSWLPLSSYTITYPCPQYIHLNPSLPLSSHYIHHTSSVIICIAIYLGISTAQLAPVLSHEHERGRGPKLPSKMTTPALRIAKKVRCSFVLDCIGSWRHIDLLLTFLMDFLVS